MHGGDGAFGRREPARRHAADQETGVIIGITAEKLKFQSSDEQSTARAMQSAMLMRQRRPASASPDRAAGKPRTMASSTIASAELCARRTGASAPQPFLCAKIRDGEHHQQRHHDAGQDAGHEQRADRDVGHHAVDDEGQRRREDRPERRGGGGDADRGLDRVAVVLHRLDLDRADAGGIGDRRARHAGEDHRADDVHVGEAALHPADEREREVVDAVGDAGDVHQVAGEDEERHGEQREALDAGDHPLRGNRAGSTTVAAP